VGFPGCGASGRHADMIVLGLSQVSPHDPSAALLVDGKIAACVEQERISRRKHAIGEASTAAAAACLGLAGLKIQDVDAVAVPYSFENVRKLRLASFRRSLGRRGMKAWRLLVKDDKVGRRTRERAAQSVAELGGDPERTPIVCVEHHVAHAGSAFFFSGMPSCAILTVDGEGELTTTFFGESDRARGVRALYEIPRPDSLGRFYSSMTEYLGFQSMDGEYKVMGMAPYGDPQKLDFSDIVSYGDGDYRLNLRYVHSPREIRHEGHHFSRYLVERFGPPREGDGLSEPYIHVAAATQKMLEDVTLHLIEHHLRDVLERHDGRLAFAGGCALNVRLNRKIIEHPLVKELFVQPAAGDSGLSVGAAACIAHSHGDAIEAMVHPYHGPEYSQEEIDRALGGAGFSWRHVEDPAGVAADLLHQGRVVAWFQGRMEWGPRALGNRSILGNPTIRGTADHINQMIKFREVWRPFCPSVLEEYAHDFVDGNHASPFMTFSFKVKEAWKDRVPEVVHVDQSARPQFVSRETNPLFHELISKFHEKSGCPIVINTSLNRRGEPMVCSPEDAVAMFQGSGLTHMIMGRSLVVKTDGGA
jgi:carbamoyltransferase